MIGKRSIKRGLRSVLALASAGLLTAAPATADVPVTPVLDYSTIVDEAVIAPEVDKLLEDIEHVGSGMASYYGQELAGNRTANGERFDPHGMTAAHRTLPLGSKLRVTNLANGKSVVVRVNDRGPFKKARIIDVSLGAAKEIQMVRAGSARVKLELLR
jgi:rare lipoprotein A